MDIPMQNYSINDTVTRFLTIQNLYSLKDVKNATALTKRTAEYIDKEIKYIVSLSPELHYRHDREVQLSLSVLHELEKLATDNKQQLLSKQLEDQFMRLQQNFES